MLTWSVLVMAGFFALPQNRDWLFKTTGGYWQDFWSQKGKQDLAHRTARRWGRPYTYSKSIAAHFAKKNNENTLILLPPTTYFKHYGIDYHVPEPAVFYYYTRLKTVWANSPKAATANWYVTLRNGKMVVDSVTDVNALRDTVAAYKKFGVSL